MGRDESEKERGPEIVGLTTNSLQLIPVLDTLAIYEARLEEGRRLHLKRAAALVACYTGRERYNR